MRKFKEASLIILVLLCTFSVVVFVKAAIFVSLNTADNFAVIAATGITNNGTSVITGNVGLTLASGSAYSGLTAGQVTGTIYAIDGSGPTGSVSNPTSLANAKNDFIAAYDNAAGQTPLTATIPKEIGGTTQFPGVYDSSEGTFSITSGNVSLDALGDPNAVFIFVPFIKHSSTT